MSKLAQLARDRSYLSVNWQNPINKNHRLNQGLVAWWLVVPHWSGGTVLRDLCNKNHGTLTNMDPSTDWLPSSRSGGFGALDFDGSDDYVNCGSIALPATGSMSIWFQANVTPGSDNSPLWHSNVSSSLFQLYPFGNGVFYAGWFQVGDDHRVAWTISGLAANEWHNATVTWVNGGTTTLYINAGSVATNSSLSSTFDTTTGNNFIGGETISTPDSLNGQIDDIRIYDRVLKASEVRDLYLRSKQHQRGLLNRRPSYNFRQTPFQASIGELIAGLTSAQSESGGWNAKVKTALTNANITRVSDTVVEIIVPGISDYDITAQETITATIPASALTSGQSLVASPVFTVDQIKSALLSGTVTATINESDVVAGSKTIILTIDGDILVTD